jgi:hypothetical protein
MMHLNVTSVPHKGVEIDLKLEIHKPCGGSIDLCHGMTVFGIGLSAKPKNILELGIGTGFVTDLLLKVIEYNQVGELTCVDNFHDLGGNLPESTLNRLRNTKAKIFAPIEERHFVQSVQENTYDFLISDADHNHAGEWVDQIFKIMKPNSFMFFHDVNGYENLKNYLLLSEKYNKPYFLFEENTRNYEECNRGWLMVINKK